jgi:8-oxo-dGTP pyrophosphatase MutT (NUDIX family)
MSSKSEKSQMSREFSAGGVVFRRFKAQTSKAEIKWVVRKTVASDLYPDEHWMLPKGRIDDTPDDQPGPMASGAVRADEASLRGAALREVAEEIGVEAEIIGKIGTIKYSFIDPRRRKILKFVTFYLMEWRSDLPDGFSEAETSEVVWLPFEKAKKTLSFYGERQVLKKAQELLASVV